ncbi:MAG TPA: oligosaccharide flippase family protein [Myxococcales bacterium]|nr:oligosaccharide flippase family protein [Myxococcales bacterium]
MSRADAGGEKPPDSSPPQGGSPAHAGGLVARNTLALVFSQFVTTPVSIVVNAVLARSLGAADFGVIYFANTTLLVAFLFIEWGGQLVLAGDIARDRSRAGELFGAGAALRVGLTILLLLGIPRVSEGLGYDARMETVLLLVAARMGVGSIGALCNAVFRGFEKLSWCARTTVFTNVFEAAVLVPTLLLGGRLKAALIAQLIACCISTGVQIALLIRLRIGRVHLSREALGDMLRAGLGFVILDLVLRLQPYIDAHFLSKLARPEAMGWYSAANRIVGVLLFPATTLAYAIYPTISRLFAHDRPSYDALVRLALRAVTLVGLFAGTGAILFAPIAVDLIYSADRFGPATDNLRILAVYIVLVYASIVVGISIAAANRQVPYAVAQSFCVVVALVLDPILVPYFERVAGNGGLGASVSVTVAEVAMVAAGMAILPRGVVNRSLLGTAGRALVAALGMAAVGLALRSLPVLALPLSVATYAGLLWALGGLDREIVDLLRSMIVRKRPEPVAVAQVGVG